MPAKLDSSVYLDTILDTGPSADCVDGQLQENNLLQPFLANKEALLTTLKVAVHTVPGCDDVLAAMANLSIECLEQVRASCVHGVHPRGG